MNWLKKNIIIKTTSESYLLLSPTQRKRSLIIVLFILLIGIMDVFGLASILPVIYMASNLSIITDNYYIYSIYKFIGLNNPNYFLLLVVSFVLFIFIIKNSLAIYFSFLQSKFAYDVAFDLNERKFNQFYQMDFSSVKSINSNITAANIANLPVEFANGIMIPLFIFLSEIIVVFFLIIGIAIADYKLLLIISCILLPSSFLFYRAIRNRTYQMGKSKNAERYMMYQFLYQSIQGYVDVLVLNKVKYFLNKYFDKQRKLYNLYVKLGVLETMPSRFLEVIALLGVVLIFFYCIIFNLKPSYLIAFLTLFVMAAYRMIPSINRIIIAVVKLKSMNYVLEVFSDIPYKSKQSEQKNVFTTDSPSPLFNNNFEFKNVNYQYEGANRKALDNVSFKINKGDIVGFIGTSGSGKTTLFNVLLRLLKQQSGEFLIDNIPLADEYIYDWRKTIGFVRQDFYLIDATLAENIGFGIDRIKIDDEKVMQCLKSACLHDFVKTLPKGINTQIGEFGGKLSGGQKQRIAIARALYHDSEIILFDEATSALDSETENEIIDTINNLFNEQKTMLLIAHRYTTLKKCNRIYEMKDGKIIAIHKYEDLIRERIQI